MHRYKAFVSVGWNGVALNGPGLVCPAARLDVHLAAECALIRSPRRLRLFNLNEPCATVSSVQPAECPSSSRQAFKWPLCFGRGGSNISVQPEGSTGSLFFMKTTRTQRTSELPWLWMFSLFPLGSNGCSSWILLRLVDVTTPRSKLAEPQI